MSKFTFKKNGENKTNTQQPASSASNNKKINKSQASTGTTVEKKHLHIFGNGGEKKPKEKLTPVDKTLGHSIKADHKFVHKWGRKVENSQKFENFTNDVKAKMPKSPKEVGGFFSKASASISGKIQDHKAKKELRETTFRNARQAARDVWNKEYKPTKAEKAVMH